MKWDANIKNKLLMNRNYYSLASLGDKQQSLLVWLFALNLIVSIPPFYFWSISKIIGVLTTCGFFFFGLWKKPQNRFRWISLCLFIIFYIYASFNLYEGLNETGKLWNGFRLFITIAIFFISEENWIKIYKCFLLIYVVTLIPSLLVYFGVKWGGIALPYTIIPPVNELKSINYLAYPFMVITNTFDNFRFCGYYDEPGVIGNISGVLLIVNRCDLRDWKNWILLISGLFSFSLFFYVLVALYFLLFGSTKEKMGAALIVVIVITYFVESNSVFSQYILTRLEIGDDGEWVGDNRTHAFFESFYDRFLHSDKLWFGYGHLYSSYVVDTGGQSYKHLVVDHGIIMSIVYVVAFFFYCLSYNLNKRNTIFLMTIILSILFQRPFITYLLYLFLMIAPAAMVKYDTKEELNSLPNKRVKTIIKRSTIVKHNV